MNVTDTRQKPSVRHCPTTDLEDLDTAALIFHRSDPARDRGAQRQARDDLIAFALPFAGRIACRYGWRGEPMDDLEQVARLGLVKAVDRYDPERGSFTAYAVVTMVGELKRHFRDRTWGTHVPRGLRDLSVVVGRATTVLTHELSRPPTPGEIAERVQTSEAEIHSVRECVAANRPMSLSMPVGGNGQWRLEDVVGSPDAQLESVDDRLAVMNLVGCLPEREQRILAMRFYGNLTQADIAERIGISQMHVSRLLTRALTWLRHAMLNDEPGGRPCPFNTFNPDRPDLA
jgi:RNA polymerase sigma-B factor